MGHNPFTAGATATLPRTMQTEKITPRQIEYLTDLLVHKAALKGMDPDDAKEVTEKYVAGLTKRYASQMIDQAKADNTRLERLFKPLRVKPLMTIDVGLEDGMYVRGDGVVFKLYHTVHGANELVAKELVVKAKYEINDDGSRGPRILGEDYGSFEYRGKAPLASLAINSRRLTLEEARAFGAIYGQCCRCMAPLTHEVSIALGIGPVCGGHEYGEEFKPLYAAAKLDLEKAS